MRHGLNPEEGRLIEDYDKIVPSGLTVSIEILPNPSTLVNHQHLMQLCPLVNSFCMPQKRHMTEKVHSIGLC